MRIDEDDLALDLGTCPGHVNVSAQLTQLITCFSVSFQLAKSLIVRPYQKTTPSLALCSDS